MKCQIIPSSFSLNKIGGLELYTNRKEKTSTDICFRKENFINHKEEIFDKYISEVFILYDSETLKAYVYLKEYTSTNVFYFVLNQGVYIGRSLYELIQKSEDKTININSLYSNTLFNYPIGKSTIIDGAFSIEPGTFVIFDEDIRIFRNATPQKKDNTKTKPSELLKNHLIKLIDNKKPVLLSLTGGFDSRVNFALLKDLGVNFEAFTYGNPNSNDSLPAISLCKKFDIKHHFIDLNTEFYLNRERYLHRVIQSSLSNPFVLDLTHFEYIKDVFPESNIIMGLMGGEILTGPSVGISQVTFTQMSHDLLSSKNIKELYSKFEQNFDSQFLKRDYVEDFKKSLTELNKYFFTEDNRNLHLTSFLKDEVYYKFFGVIKSIFESKHNQIDTFMAPSYFNYVHSLKFNYNNTPLFKRSPLNNFHSRKFYAEIIRDTSPQLLNTKLDRGYYVKDLLSPFGLFNISRNFYLNHTGKGNKKNIKTIDYREWFESDVFDFFKSENVVKDFYDVKFINQIIDGFYKDKKAYPVSVFNKLMLIYGLLKSINLIKTA